MADSTAPSSTSSSPLAAHEGLALLTAAEAILKGVLQSELPIAEILGPEQGGFRSLFAAARREAAARLLSRHETQVTRTGTAARAVSRAMLVGRFGRSALAFVPAAEMVDSVPSLRRLLGQPLHRQGAVGIVIEDDPALSPGVCPRVLSRQLDLTAIEPVGVGQLPDALEAGLRLSRASHRPVVLVIHHSIVNSMETIRAQPNRVMESVDAMLARRRTRRPPKLPESGGLLRLIRRLEFNTATSLPSPGERVPIGFVTVGAADLALRHVTRELGLTGRVPVVQLGALHPLDETLVERLLERCEQVIVLEPRPGSVESLVLSIAERLRDQGRRTARLWGRFLPPTEDGVVPRLNVDDAVHPSLLARRVSRLLHLSRPRAQISQRLHPDPPAARIPVPPRHQRFGPEAAAEWLRRIAADVDQWLREREATEEEEEAFESISLSIDGSLPAAPADCVLPVETFTADRFRREVLPAFRAGDPATLEPGVAIVMVGSTSQASFLRREIDASMSERAVDAVRLREARFDEPGALREIVRDAALLTTVLTVIIVSEGAHPRYDAEEAERRFERVDRLGYEPRQTVVWPMDQICAVRPPDTDLARTRFAVRHDQPLKSAWSWQEANRRGPWIRFAVRPLMEQVEVVRTQPPIGRWQQYERGRIELPEIRHRQAPSWRLHVAGIEHEPPGAAARLLALAGARMGYHVKVVHNPLPIAAARRAWSQVLFTRPVGEGETPAISGRIPFGEADVLLGHDAWETIRAITADPALWVAAEGRTSAALNLRRDAEDESDVAVDLNAEITHLASRCLASHPLLKHDFTAACREAFHTNRVADVAMIGAAYQLGLIPVTFDAIDDALRDLEAFGYGRAREAFRFGRRIASESRLLLKPLDDRHDDVEQIVRRFSFLLSRRRVPLAKRRLRLRELMRTSLNRMPGLQETDSGRAARRDFAVALYRCFLWGGLEYAQRFADLIVNLYQSDRGDTGRALTRSAVLPLAGSMLIRDPIYVASMAASTEQRRRTRRTLNVKRTRRDQIDRRYLTRFDLHLGNRRLRADVRTSDWLVAFIGLFGFITPTKWRGTKRERAIRDTVMDIVEKAARSTPHNYEAYREVLRRLHDQATDHRLREMTIPELQMLIGSFIDDAENGRKSEAAKAATTQPAEEEETPAPASTS